LFGGVGRVRAGFEQDQLPLFVFVESSRVGRVVVARATREDAAAPQRAAPDDGERTLVSCRMRLFVMSVLRRGCGVRVR
jgi:hypothetical protein